MLMRIFYAADSSPNPGFSSNLWRNNLHDSLVELGHDVVEFRYDLHETFSHLDPARPDDLKFIDNNRPALSAELLRQIRAAHAEQPVTLFFSYFYNACVLPETLDEIRSLGILTVNWYCNASYQFHLVREISPHYDWCLVPEKFRLKDYEAIGARPLYCQEAANPNIYRPFDLPREFEVTFIGQAYGERPDYVRHLRGCGIDIRVWGANWEYHVQPVSRNPFRRWFQKVPGGIPAHAAGGILGDREMIELYSRSKINLGFSSCGDTHLGENRILQVRLRDFEVPMSGGFYLTEYQPELEEFFEIDREIVCYRTRDELVDKIRFYLKHETAREKIRISGLERSLRDHTWQKRFRDAFAVMGIA